MPKMISSFFDCNEWPNNIPIIIIIIIFMTNWLQCVFCSHSTRCLWIYSVDDLSSSLNCLNFDITPAILIPHYDCDSNTLLLTGRVSTFTSILCGPSLWYANSLFGHNGLKLCLFLDAVVRFLISWIFLMSLYWKIYSFTFFFFILILTRTLQIWYLIKCLQS